MSFPVCLGAVPEDVRVRALAAGRADEDAVSLVPGSFEVGYVAEDGSAHRERWAGAASDGPVQRFGATRRGTWPGRLGWVPRAASSVWLAESAAERRAAMDVSALALVSLARAGSSFRRTAEPVALPPPGVCRPS